MMARRRKSGSNIRKLDVVQIIKKLTSLPITFRLAKLYEVILKNLYTTRISVNNLIAVKMVKKTIIKLIYVSQDK